MGQRNYNIDALLILADGAAATTANGIAQVSSASRIIDLGGALTRTDIGLTGGLSRFEGVVVLDLSAVVVSTNDDLYIVRIMGSNSSDGSAAVPLGALTFGHTTMMPNGASTSVVGRYELFFCTEQADINYEYVYLYNTVVGTGKSLTYKAFIAPLPDAY
jgi:hypothetical protein